MSYQLSDNAKTVLMAAITMIGGVLTLWVQNHNQHADKMAAEKERVEVLKSIDAKLTRPVVYGENQ